MTARTVTAVNQTVVSLFFNTRVYRRSMGKSNHYDKMEWQDSIKVIITQKLHQIRNWEFHNMLYGMSTIEIIENLIIENLTENRVIRRFGWPPTNYIALTFGSGDIMSYCPEGSHYYLNNKISLCILPMAECLGGPRTFCYFGYFLTIWAFLSKQYYWQGINNSQRTIKLWFNEEK